MSGQSPTPPGFYDDGTGTQRWFDGYAWGITYAEATAATQSQPAPPPATPWPSAPAATPTSVGAAPTSTDKPFYTRWWFFTAVGVILLFVIAGVAGAAGGSKSNAGASAPLGPSQTPVTQAATPQPTATQPTTPPPTTAKPTTAPPKTAPPATQPPAAPAMTQSEQNAIQAANDYLQTQSFSKAGLINQLSSSYGDGYPKADAVFAVNHITVDWNAQAVRAAKEYLATQPFSRNDLIQQLSSSYGDGFTKAQAIYAVNKVGL